MAIPPFKRLNFSDQVLQRFQDNIGAVLDALATTQINQGKLVTFIATADIPSPNDFTINHNLGFVPAGIFSMIPPYSAFSTPGFGGAFVQSNTPNPTPKLSTILFCTNEIRKGAALTFWVF